MTARRAAIGAGLLVTVAVVVVFCWRLRDERAQAPANIRIVQSDVTGEQWIRWDDNSSDEAGFRGSVRLLRDGGVIAISELNTPRPGESQAPVTPFDSKYAGEGCYDAVIKVEAVTMDGDTLAAKDARATVCIDEGGSVRYEPFEWVPEPLVFPEPPPDEARARVIRDADNDNVYELTFDIAVPPQLILTTSRVYTEAGHLIDERNLSAVSGETASIELDPAEGLAAEACYRREFVSWTIRVDILRGWTTTTQPVCLQDGVAGFPVVDDPNVAVPATATNVRVAKDEAGSWRIEWRDNSDNETTFELLVSVLAEGSGDFVYQQGVSAGPNETSVLVPQEVLALASGCYLTTIYVFVERFDTANGIPGNISLRLCLDAAGATFEASIP